MIKGEGSIFFGNCIDKQTHIFLYQTMNPLLIEIGTSTFPISNLKTIANKNYPYSRAERLMLCLATQYEASELELNTRLKFYRIEI